MRWASWRSRWPRKSMGSSWSWPLSFSSSKEDSSSMVCLSGGHSLHHGARWRTEPQVGREPTRNPASLGGGIACCSSPCWGGTDGGPPPRARMSMVGVRGDRTPRTTQDCRHAPSHNGRAGSPDRTSGLEQVLVEEHGAGGFGLQQERILEDHGGRSRYDVVVQRIPVGKRGQGRRQGEQKQAGNGEHGPSSSEWFTRPSRPLLQVRGR